MKPRKSKCNTISGSKDERKAGQGFVDLKKKSVAELDELIDRQNKLLQNRLFLEKLPDKGQKIFSFKSELETERKKKLQCDAVCQILSKVTLNDINVDELEWNEEKPAIHKSVKNVNEEFSQEDSDVLKVVANHSGTAGGKSKTSSVSCEGFSSLKKVDYVDKFCEKYGKPEKCKERFKPNQLRNNDKTLYKSSAEKVKEILGSKWEVTEATPPIPIFNDTVMIGLSESLKLQKKQAEVLKEINKKHATEKLLQNISLKMGDKLPVNNITQYRSGSSPFEESADDDDDDDDAEDSEEEEKNKLNICDDEFREEISCVENSGE